MTEPTAPHVIYLLPADTPPLRARRMWDREALSFVALPGEALWHYLRNIWLGVLLTFSAVRYAWRIGRAYRPDQLWPAFALAYLTVLMIYLPLFLVFAWLGAHIG